MNPHRKYYRWLAYASVVTGSGNAVFAVLDLMDRSWVAMTAHLICAAVGAQITVSSFRKARVK